MKKLLLILLVLCSCTGSNDNSTEDKKPISEFSYEGLVKLGDKYLAHSTKPSYTERNHSYSQIARTLYIRAELLKKYGKLK